MSDRQKKNNNPIGSTIIHGLKDSVLQAHLVVLQTHGKHITVWMEVVGVNLQCRYGR
jgi:hypothetical protein